MAKIRFPLLAAIALAAVSAHADDAQQARVEKSRAAAKSLMGALQTELAAAIKAGGPQNAIQVCNEKAPAIAADISRQQNLKVGRTSLKLRNPKNAPDAWEQKTLMSFEERKAKGEDPAKIEHAEVVGKEFRYMKAIAIPADAPCLKCHGTEIDPAVQVKLKALYPTDKATGYVTGDLRGAFTIRQPL